MNKKVTSSKTKYIEAEIKITDLTNKVVQILEKQYDERMYFTVDDGYQNFLVFTPIVSSLMLMKNQFKKLLTGYRLEHHLKKLNHLTLILNQQCLI